MLQPVELLRVEFVEEHKRHLPLHGGIAHVVQSVAARTGALLAALMEEGDRNFNVLAEDLEVERMAELEHGRWNVERLRDGWRYGKTRDDSRKIHDCLVPWTALPDEIKKYDRNAVRAFPEILAKAKLEVRRMI